jgi:hypothetical protein
MTLRRLSVVRKWGEAIPKRMTRPMRMKSVCRRAVRLCAMAHIVAELGSRRVKGIRN